jgi:hypothetical protein
VTEQAEPVFFYPTIRSSQWTPRGRSVLVRAEQPPARASSIWTPHHREAEGRALGFVVYGRVVRVGPGDWEPAWIQDEEGKSVRDGQQRSAPRIKYRVQGRQGPETRERVEPGRLVWVPTKVKVGDRVVWAHGWGPKVELADGVHFNVHENGIQGAWTDEHEHCVHHDAINARFLCCDEGCRWESRAFETILPSCGTKAASYPRVAEAVIGRDPTRIDIPFADDPNPDPDEVREQLLVREGESER